MEALTCMQTVDLMLDCLFVSIVTKQTDTSYNNRYDKKLWRKIVYQKRVVKKTVLENIFAWFMARNGQMYMFQDSIRMIPL